MDATTNAVTELPTATTAVTITPMQMLQIAVQQGADLDRLQKLMDLQERWEASQARKSFVAAMAEFKRNPPEIVKNKHVRFQTAKGLTEYDHATLDVVCSAVIEGLSTVGITHDWETEQPNGRIRVTCVLTHVDGHSKRTTLESAPDDSGGKNNIQAIASAVSYLQRYTLLAATGLAVKGMDDDGRRSEKRSTLTDDQVANLEALLSEVGANKRNFLRWARVDSLEDILAANYSACVHAIEAKRHQA